MPFYIVIAFKNIFRDLRRSITLGINYFFITILLVLVFSATEGVKKNITRNVLTSTAGNITITGEYIVKGKTYQGISQYQTIDSIVRSTFKDANVVTRYSMSIAVYYKGISKRLSFSGINPSIDRSIKDQITISSEEWNAFLESTNAVLIPKSVATYFGLKINDELLIATRSKFGAFNTGTIKIAGIFSSGNYFLKDQVVSNFGFLQSFDLADQTTASKMFVYFNKSSGIDTKRNLLLEKLGKADFVANKPANNNDALNAVSAASPRYKVQDSTLNQKRLTLSTADEVIGIVSQVVNSINSVGLFVAAIMLFIISVSIFINMRMTINDRMIEIGTLRAMGCEKETIVTLFITENILLSVLFIFGGIIAAFLIMFLSKFISIPSDGTIGIMINQGHFVFEPTIFALLFIIIILTLFTALFSYFPARFGGKIPIVNALNKTN